jgi:hypothetical protein
MDMPDNAQTTLVGQRRHPAAPQPQHQQMRSAGAAVPNPPAPAAHRRVSEPRAQPARRLSKAEALRLAERLKTAVLTSTLVGFGATSVLLANHIAATSTIQSSTSSGQPSSSSSSSSGGFFNPQGGASFGSNSSSSPQAPSSASSVS